MAETEVKKGGRITQVLIIGALWGIFEATVGYLLHLLPVSIGFLVWYPAAVGFMAVAYRATGERQAVLWVAVLSAGIKLFNLLTPIRADYVINPAVSILLESLVFTAVASLTKRDGWAHFATKAGSTVAAALATVLANTLWRGGYIIYLLTLVPEPVRVVSVLRSGAHATRFLLTDNLCSSAVIFGGLLLGRYIAGRVTPVEGEHKLSGVARAAVPVALLALSVALQIIL